VQLWVNSIDQVGGLAASPWLDTGESGTLAPDGSAEVGISIDATSLTPGVYPGAVSLTSDAGREGQVTVPVTATVLGCDRTITGTHLGRLTVTDGVTCLAEGARVIGPVQVGPGAGLVATGATVIGPVAATGATIVELRATDVIGTVVVEGTTGRVTVAGGQLRGQVQLAENTTGGTPIVISGNRIIGSLACTGNQPPPIDGGDPNSVTGPATGQCADL
ncbi:MAG: hypothetical protein ACRDT2_21130, partial [Natronosporangium sp.]